MLDFCRRNNRLLMIAALAFLLPSAVSAATDKHNSALNLKDLRAFTEVYIQIRDQYYGSIDQNEIFQHAISGMLADLDPHSSYLSKEEYADLNNSSQGLYAGIGVEISTAVERLEITLVIEDSPAANAGVAVGDIVTAVNGHPVRGRLIIDSLEELRGEPGTKVLIDILSKTPEPGKSSSNIRTLKLERAIIHYNEISSHRLIDNLLLIQIKSFQHSTARELQVEIETQLAEASIPGLILDLRNNPGGILNSGVSVADHFMSQGLIVSTRTRGEVEDLRLSADNKQLLGNIPLVVLINSGTASAAEIVAGALQDSHRATIVGEKSFGKGSVQSVFPLSNGGALKLTTAHYFTPSGRVIHHQGIQPDVVIKETPSATDDDPVLTAGVEVLRGL